MMRPPTAARTTVRPTRRKISTPVPRGRVWHWAFRYPLHNVLEAGDPGYDEAAYFNRPTPTGLTEQEMLSTVNYLDEEALQQFRGVGPTIALNIVNWRRKHHYLSSLDELIEVPGIGPKKFQELTGRENLSQEFPLHDIFRISRKAAIAFDDLQPVRRPAPGIESLYLDSPDSTRKHKLNARQGGFQFVTRKVLDRQLCFYVAPTEVSARARYLLDKLPHLLRRLIKEHSTQ